MENTKNIFQKMSAITAELQIVAKNLVVQQTQTSSYKAVSERDVLDAVKPLEEKHGVYSYPCNREILESNLLESETAYKDKTVKKTTFMTRIKTTYRFVNVDDPADYIETVTFAEGIDTQDKGSGKAMTYGDKYALLKAYKISTGEDPDQTASGEEHFKNATPKAEAKISATAEFKCADCGAPIKAITKPDGTMWMPAAVAKASIKKYGIVLCEKCRQEAEQAMEAHSNAENQ